VAGLEGGYISKLQYRKLAQLSQVMQS